MSGGTGRDNPRSAAHPQTRDRARYLGIVFARRRRALHLSQEQLAEKAGVDRQSINRLENARFSPSVHRLWLIADALDEHLDVLLREAREEQQKTDTGRTD